MDKAGYSRGFDSLHPLSSINTGFAGVPVLTGTKTGTLLLSLRTYSQNRFWRVWVGSSRVRGRQKRSGGTMLFKPPVPVVAEGL